MSKLALVNFLLTHSWDKEIFYVMLIQFTVVLFGLFLPLYKILKSRKMMRFSFILYVLCTWLNGIAGFLYSAYTIANYFNYSGMFSI